VSQCDRSATRERRLVQEIAPGTGTAGWIRTTDLLIHSQFAGDFCMCRVISHVIFCSCLRHLSTSQSIALIRSGGATWLPGALATTKTADVYI
jgi:hypothetical protein